jgi:hypothetical protein
VCIIVCLTCVYCAHHACMCCVNVLPHTPHHAGAVVGIDWLRAGAQLASVDRRGECVCVSVRVSMRAVVCHQATCTYCAHRHT